jgi:hypothetical protein
MSNFMHGAKPGKVTPNKKAAGGLTTPATTNNVQLTVTVFSKTKAVFIRFASWLALMVRGVS